MENDNNKNFVISGMSGRFPQSDNVDIFWENLIQGMDMISENNRSWNIKELKTPARSGNIECLDKFDASFFGVSGTQANAMDPKIRIALEVAHEAVIDAGLNPKSLDGARVGVFMSASFSEAPEIWLRSSEDPTGHYITGSHPCMLSDRIAYTFNFIGPSCTMDSACSSSFSALQYAMLALKNRICDSAIVGGANINISPLITRALFNTNALSTLGESKVFDADCDGFVRSEAVVALYICRNDQAKRSYASIAGVRCCSDGYKSEGITVPSTNMQTQLITELYAEAGVNPLDVLYVEAHGTGTILGDFREINSLAQCFCKGRKEPLLVGSVKSNMGHSEPVSGLCGIVKVLLSSREGVIPPNINFKTPNPECSVLTDGTMKVVTEPTPFRGPFVGVNSFGIGGTSGHVILQFDDIDLKPVTNCDSDHILLTDDNDEWRPGMLISEDIPKLILASGRTNEAVQHFLSQAQKYSENAGFVGLLHKIALSRIPKHDFVGHALITLSGDSEVTFEAKKEPLKSIWYVYTGLGGQWIGLANDMIRFKSFKKSIHLSSKYLQNVGVDLKSVFQTQDLEYLNHLQNAFVAIIACEIAVTDLLNSLDIITNGILGHSLGEVCCGYADGCLTHEQTILTAHYRARGFLESNLPPGTMASVALTWEDAQKRCPSDIFPAIHNAKHNITIGGPTKSIRTIVQSLTNDGIFAKEVKAAMYAFHTPYVRPSENLMLKFLKKVIPEPKRRSSKWLSSSIQENDWNSELAKLSSAEYFVNNGISSVYLYEVLQHIPEKALVVEIGPHCFLQTILKQTLMDRAVIVGLMHCKHDNVFYFLKSMGRVFLTGFNFNINAMYEPLEFPVPVKTPSISPLIKWDHRISWDVPHYLNEISANQGTKYVINLSSDDAFSGHVIQNKIIFPAAGYIYLVWKAFAKLQSVNLEDLPVHVENIRFMRMREFHSNRNLEFNVRILYDTGCFEIAEGNEVVCSGTIQRAAQINQIVAPTDAIRNTDNILVHEDFYKLLHLKGYGYQGLFRGVQKIEFEGRWAELDWNDNWTCFFDTMLQIWILHFDYQLKDLVVPQRLEKITIYPTMFKDSLGQHLNSVQVTHCKYLNIVQCPGIIISGLKTTASSFLLPTKSNPPTIMYQRFFPFFDPHSKTVTTEAALEFFFGIVVDNSFPVLNEPFIFAENLEYPHSVCTQLLPSVFPKFESFEHRLILEKYEENKESLNTSINCKIFESMTDLNLLPRSHLIWINLETQVESCADLLVDNGFLILSTCNEELMSNMCIISQKRSGKTYMYLLRKKSIPHSLSTTIVSIDIPNFEWVDVLKEKIVSAKNESRLHILSISASSGIVGLTKCLLKEPGCQNIRCIHIHNSVFSNPENNSQFTNDVLKKDLVFNIYTNDSWGTYVHMKGANLFSSRLSEHVYANIQMVGDLSSLCWVENSNQLFQREIFTVHFSSLNFKDIMYVMGKLPKTAFPEIVQRGECLLGIEFSGTYKHKRVCGLSYAKCLSSSLDHEPSMIWNVPDDWSLEEAATIPISYATVLYAFLMRGRLKQNEIVLIHSGSGAVGLAAITVALDLNCIIFTTVSSLWKKNFLMNKFPELHDERILDSKAGSKFKEDILRLTKGKGVDVVLNSLAQEQMKASWDCLSKGGRFLEIGKFDAFNNTTIGLQVLLKSVDIQSIHLDNVTISKSAERSHLKTLMQDYLDSGKIKPLPFTCFGHENLEDAFRYLSSRTHVGKVVIKVREPSGHASVSAIPRTYFYPHKTYLIIGGLGGMGLEIITWMIERGARKIFIVSRSGVTTSYQKFKVKKWNDVGATIFLRNTDFSTRSNVSELIAEAVTVGPLGGIFNLALVLQDGLFVNQTAKKFDMVSKCKVTASVHLDYFSRLYRESLDYFVVFSSISCGKGNPGQSNYAYANSVMERICEERKSDGLPALAIQWGPVGDVGSVARMFAGKTIISGVVGQPISSCITTLDLLLQQTEVVVSSTLFHEADEIVSNVSKEVSLSHIIAGILGIQDISKIKENMTLTEHGMDSIMAAQIQYAIHRKKNVYIPASSYGNLTFKDLLAMD